MGKTALIAGATGLIGRELVKLILSDPYYDKVKVVARKATGLHDDRLEEIIIDFENLEEHKERLSATHYYVTLGTTMRQVKTKENFYKVDFGYPYALAKIAKEDEVFEKYLLVTAFKASSESMIYYNRVKGQLEDALKAIKLQSLHIFQPSLLIGFRPDFRIFEEASKIIMPILVALSFGQIKFKAIEGITVAKALLKVGKEGIDGVHTYPSHIIEELSKSSLPPEEIAR
ncbi:MAG: NAD-dependent epimerase/dehydratase family protein [Cyclobacteriaceae bacterium]